MKPKDRRTDLLFFSSIRLCRAEWPQEGRIRARNLDKGALFFAESGRASLTVDGQHHLVEAGESFWLSPGSRIGLQWAEAFRCSFLLFACRRMRRFGGQWLATETDWPKSARLTSEKENVEAWLSVNGSAPSRDRLELKHTLHRWIDDRYRQQENSNGESAQSGDREATGSAEIYMSEHYARELSVTELADRAGLSVNHFIRTFKARTGRTPAQYLLNLRMNKAKQLLFSTDKIKTIARSVGYKDEHYFSRAFKKTEGMAPAYYMKHPERRIAAVYYGLDDYLRTLGITPVAALAHDRSPRDPEPSSRPSGHEDGKTVWLDASAIEYAKLSRAAPDLILTSSHLEAEERLERIAPTVTVPYTHDLARQLRHMGEILGRHREAEEWVVRYLQARQEMRRRLRDHGANGTACYIRVGASLCRVYGRINQTGALLYDDLGLRLPERFPIQEWALTISQEQLTEFDSDYLFIAVEPTPEAAGRMRAIAASEEWRSLRAVRAGRVYDARRLLIQTLGPSGRLDAMQEIFGWLTESKVNLST